jgi:hypothetical protein
MKNFTNHVLTWNDIFTQSERLTGQFCTYIHAHVTVHVFSTNSTKSFSAYVKPLMLPLAQQELTKIRMLRINSYFNIYRSERFIHKSSFGLTFGLVKGQFPHIATLCKNIFCQNGSAEV